ncbi:MAG: NAD(P)H-dependent oxidoreductase subunit E, partial [Bacteroidales bacterium]|nr:NAD(P)H-dependent oxidoreductase subunit E [Bacteroidales bacterium]
MNRKSENIEAEKCNCHPVSTDEITAVVDEVVKYTGREKDKVILILQEVQKRLNFLPSEALKHICSVTDITPGQISGVSTFYSQFRHIPAGKHTVKICAGTACHVKGSQLISDAFRRVLKIDESRSTSADNLFSIEEVACLGCCTLAPVVQIDNKTYGHVKPTETEDILKDFLNTVEKTVTAGEKVITDDFDAEIRIGLGSCCVAGGSKEVLSRLIEIREGYDLNIRLKPVGCVGVCNQTPLLEIVTKDEVHSRYTNVKTDQVEEIILKHVTPRSLKKKIRYRINDLADTFLSDHLLKSPVNIPTEQREKYLNNFTRSQVHLATMNSGILTPDSIDEYTLLGGFDALKRALISVSPSDVIDIITRSGLRGRGGAGFLTGRKWSISASTPGTTKYVVCNGDEGDP